MFEIKSGLEYFIKFVIIIILWATIIAILGFVFAIVGPLYWGIVILFTLIASPFNMWLVANDWDRMPMIAKILSVLPAGGEAKLVATLWSRRKVKTGKTTKK